MKSTLLWSYFNQMDFNWVSENSLQIRKYENSSCNHVRTHWRCSHCLHPSRESVASLLRFQGRAQCPQARGSSEAGRPVFPLLHHYLMILKKCPRPSDLPPEATEKAGDTLLLGLLGPEWGHLVGRNQHGPRARAMLFRERYQMKCSHLKSVSLRLDTAVERPQILE